MGSHFFQRRFRKRIFRAFQAWYKTNKTKLAYSLCLTECRGDMLSFQINGIHPSISVVLTREALSVCIEWEQTTWDMLISLDAIAERNRSGSGLAYHCALCASVGPTASFPSRDALWADHLFEPLAEWLKESLTTATHLCLSGSEAGGATWASLLDSNAQGHEVSPDLLYQHVCIALKL